MEEFFLPPLSYKCESKREEYQFFDAEHSGSPLSSAHAYKVEGGGRILRCGTAKKSQKATRDTLGLELKMHSQV